MADDRTAKGDPLTLSAGKLARLAMQQSLDAEDLRGLSTRAPILSRSNFRILRPNAMLSKTVMCG